MCIKKFTVIFTLGICLKCCVADPQGNEKWARTASFPQNNQQNILLGIEQSLRGLDTIRRIVSRNTLSLGDLTNRVELFETRLMGLLNTMTHKFDAITTAVSTAEMKFELLIDKMAGKLQTDLDRITHKLSSAEARLETTVDKIQDQMEINFKKAESKQMDISNEVLRVYSEVDMLKSQMINTEQRYNRTLGILVNHVQEIRHEHADKKEHLKNLTSLVTGLQLSKSEGPTQSDAPSMPKQQIQIIKTEINIEAQKIASKMNNMYNDMLRNIKDMEVIFKMAINENNNKSRELYNSLQEILSQDKSNSENLISFLDVIIESQMSGIQNKLIDLQRRFEADFRGLTESQETYGDSCRKVKDVIENRVAIILTRIYDTFTNRTDKISLQLMNAQELIKTENKQLSTAIGKTNHNIITLADENSQDHKQLDGLISEVGEKAEDILQEVQILQEINETFNKNQKSLKELKGFICNHYENHINRSQNSTNESFTNKINAVEANYSNGILKILTGDHSNQNGEFTEKEQEQNIKGTRVRLSKLNQTVSTSDIAAVIGESKNKNEIATSTTIAVSEEKERDRDDDDDFDAQEEFGEDELNMVDTTQLLLCYIKYLRGHLSAKEFLVDAVPGTKYDSLQDMAKQLRRNGNIPKEMITNIEDMAITEEHGSKDSNQMDKEIGNIISKLRQGRSRYETLNEDENYDE